MGDNMDWDGIWDGLNNEKNWEAEKYRAKSTLLGVQDFHKHWDRYAPFSCSNLQSGCTAQTSRTNFGGRFGTCGRQ